MNKGWREVKLGDVILLNYGKALISSNRIHGSIPVYSSGGITGYHNNPLVNSDGIIVGRKGTVGTVYYSPSPFFCIDTAYYILPSDEYNIKYMYYRLRSLGLERLNEDSAVPGLNRDTAYSQTFLLPPLYEQEVIAKTLSCLDDMIELNEAVNHHLDAMAQALFKSWFVDFEPFLDKEFTESEVWSIPKGWKIINFSSFLTSRTEKSNDSSIPMFSVTDNGIFLRSEKFNINLSSIHTKNKIIKKTDIVFGMSREVLNWGIMRSEIGGVSSAYNVFSVDNSINTKYFESFIKTHPIYFKDLIRPASREGQSVDKGALMEKSIYLPPLSVLEDFYAIEDSLTECIKANVDENRRLATLRDTLLPRLMSGELRVSDIEPSK